MEALNKKVGMCVWLLRGVCTNNVIRLQKINIISKHIHASYINVRCVASTTGSSLSCRSSSVVGACVIKLFQFSF